MRLEPPDIYGVLLTEYASKLDGLLLFYSSAVRNIDRIEKTDWKSGAEDSEDERWRMEQVGGAVFAYSHTLQELVLVGIAKAVEGLIVLGSELTGVYFDIWQNDELTLRHHHEAKYVRALNNVVKHSRSNIVDDGSPGSKFLVEKCGHQYGEGVEYLDLDIPRIIFRVSVFCGALSAHLAGVVPKALGTDEEAEIQRFREAAIPEFLDL